MSYQGKYILAAIDGTDSHKALAQAGTVSHVFNFRNDMNIRGGVAKYWHGPGEHTGLSGTIFGYGAEDKIEKVTKWIHERVIEINGELPKAPFVTLSWAERNTIRSQYHDKLRIVIVGHSRGGMIAILVASQLNFPVYFMGLYDAVDMNMAQNCDQIHNVDFAYHAIRHPVMDSRSSWGNCGDEWGATMVRNRLRPRDTLISSGQYESQYFMTSHAGVNGAPSLHPTGAVDDISCSMDTLSARIGLALNYDRGKKCESEALAADNWIRTKAKSREIAFN